MGRGAADVNVLTCVGVCCTGAVSYDFTTYPAKWWHTHNRKIKKKLETETGGFNRYLELHCTKCNWNRYILFYGKNLNRSF